jgi:hypothetical protein
MDTQIIPIKLTNPILEYNAEITKTELMMIRGLNKARKNEKGQSSLNRQKCKEVKGSNEVQRQQTYTV